MAEPIYLDDIVQSAQRHPSDREMARLPGSRDEGRKESWRDSPGEGSEWASKYLWGAFCMQSLMLSGVCGAKGRKEVVTPNVGK